MDDTPNDTIIDEEDEEDSFFDISKIELSNDVKISDQQVFAMSKLIEEGRKITFEGDGDAMKNVKFHKNRSHLSRSADSVHLAFSQIIGESRMRSTVFLTQSDANDFGIDLKKIQEMRKDIPENY